MFTAPYKVTTEENIELTFKFILDVAHYYANTSGKIVVTDALGTEVPKEFLDEFV